MISNETRGITARGFFLDDFTLGTKCNRRRKNLLTWPGHGSNQRPSAQQSNTLPRGYKSRLVQQGCTSADVPRPCDILHNQIGLRPRISDWATTQYQATKPIGQGYLRWAPDVTGAKMLITFCPGWGAIPRPSAHKSNTLPVAIKAGFYGNAVECLISTRAVRVQSLAGSGTKNFTSPVTFGGQR